MMDNTNTPRPWRVAILDLYEGHPNEGMRCIRSILQDFAQNHHLSLQKEEFEVRLKRETPGLDFDVYLSSGGPGSPLDSEGSDWEAAYFSWFHSILAWNEKHPDQPKKVFFICHSFQLICRHLELANVCKRRSTAFGVFPVHRLENHLDEAVFEGLEDPFYVVDSRDFQVIEPDLNKLTATGATVLAIEKERPHIALERAIMAMRFNEHMIGTQFHPEADAEGMIKYLLRADKKQTIIKNHGLDKWQSMVDHLADPDKILWTYSHVLPNFLKTSLPLLSKA